VEGRHKHDLKSIKGQGCSRTCPRRRCGARMRDRKTRAPGARVSWSFSAELKQSVSRMVDLCVRRGEAGDRHPVGRAADTYFSCLFCVYIGCPGGRGTEVQ
jgi:hypothetical protein